MHEVKRGKIAIDIVWPIKVLSLRLTADTAVTGCPPGSTAVSPAKSFGARQRHTSRERRSQSLQKLVPEPTWLGFRMSFIPAAAAFSNSHLLTPAGTLPMPTRAGVMSNNSTDQNSTDWRTATLKQTPDSLTAKILKRQLPRARKARARLRQQNRLRTAAVRNN
jgi:hypothetical protein